jgi:hypothetical protein
MQNAFEERGEPKLTLLSHRRQICTPAWSRRSRRCPRSPLLHAIALVRQPTPPTAILRCRGWQRNEKHISKATCTGGEEAMESAVESG